MLILAINVYEHPEGHPSKPVMSEKSLTVKLGYLLPISFGFLTVLL